MCNCIDVVNAKLAAHNTRITEPLFVFLKPGEKSVRRVFVETDRIESGRGKPKAQAMFASYCPFCGERYETAEATVEDPELSRTCYRGKTVEDGEIVLVHWPEGYRLRYHGETVWREPEVPKPDLTAN